MKEGSSYRKYTYWLDPAVHGDFIEELGKNRKQAFSAKQHPCEALYPRRNMVLVAPRIWDLRCSRQGSWYRASSRKGHFLLVSNSLIETMDPCGCITLEAFEPPQTATDSHVMEIMTDPRVPEVLPLGWGEFSPWERQAVSQYLKGNGVDRSLQEIFCYYTANHLNFIFPRFFVSDNQHPVIPYSIQQTSLVCSACVELFGILGDAYAVKYLVPCPGLKYVKTSQGQCLRLVSHFT